MKTYNKEENKFEHNWICAGLDRRAVTRRGFSLQSEIKDTGILQDEGLIFKGEL